MDVDVWDGYAIIDQKSVIFKSTGLQKASDSFILDVMKQLIHDSTRTKLTSHLYATKITQEHQTVILFENDQMPAVMQEYQLLEFIFQHSHDGIYVANRKGETIKVNPGSERNYGLSQAEFLNRHVKDLENEKVFYPSVVKKVLEKQSRVSLYQQTRIGKELMVTGNPIYDENGTLINIVCNSRDVTELLELKQELKLNEEKVKRYESELHEYRQKMISDSDFVVHNKEMQEIFELIHNIAHVDSNVVILGESGVGKEVVAKKIHKLSPQKDGPFIKVNCGAIPESLLESELFGYAPGAFTGAKKEGKIGYIELANNGTLFLDEIGEMPLLLQVKLLTVLQDKVIQRIGGTKNIPLNFRIIAATNRDLETMIKEGSFREDLYYRLHVIPISVPPLRERKDDIPFLVTMFLTEFNDKYKLEKQIDTAAIQVLMEYDFPGNVRQLKNIIERMYVLTKGERIVEQDATVALWNFLKKERHSEARQDLEPVQETIVESQTSINLVDKVKQMEKGYLEYAIKTHKTTRKAAQYLGISQSTTVRKLKEYNIQK